MKKKSKVIKMAEKSYQRMHTLSVKGKQPYFDSELAIDEGAIYKRMKLTPYTPDKLLSKKKIDILNEMMLDPEIDAAIDELKLIRLSSGWEVEAASDSTQDKEIRDFVEYNFDNVEGSFDDDLREIMGAVELGVSINEIIWHHMDSGKYAGKIGLSNIKSKNPKYFNLYTDDFDNLQEQGVVNISSLDYGRQYPVDKFIIYTFNKRYENIFGTSRIRTLYDIWFIKQVCMRAWGIYLEKFGHPIPVLRHPSGIDPKTRTYLMEVIKQIRYETGFTIPKEVELQIMETGGKAAEAHNTALTWFNMQIRKKIMGQSLTSDAGDKGAKALGSVHFDILLFYVEHLGIDVAEKAINKQLIKSLVDYNYPNVEEYPSFKFKPMIQEDSQKNIEMYYKGLEQQAIKPIAEDEDVIREFLKFPPRKVELNPAAAVIDPTLATKQTLPVVNNSENFSEKEFNTFAEKLMTGVERRKFTKYEETIDFVELKYTHESILDKYSKIAGGAVQDGIKDLILQVQRNKIIENKNFSAIQSLVFPATGELKQIFKSMLNEAFEGGIKSARADILAKKKKGSKNYSEVIKFQNSIDLRKLTYPEVLAYFEQKSFDMAGIERDVILKKVKQVLMDSIKNGNTLHETVNTLQDELKEYYNAGEISDEALKSYRLETVIRTNVTDALNQGRTEFFENPELGGYVAAYQYSAVLDDRVRPKHAALDGLIFTVSNPVWAIITPPPKPDPYNCRCTRVPVTTDEQFVEDDVPAWVYKW